MRDYRVQALKHEREQNTLLLGYALPQVPTNALDEVAQLQAQVGIGVMDALAPSGRDKIQSEIVAMPVMVPDGAPSGAANLPAGAMLQFVCHRHFERLGDAVGSAQGEPAQVTLRAVQGRSPGDRVESPYAVDIRFRGKSGTEWTAYMVRLTEICDAGAPQLVFLADTTPANIHEAMSTEPAHEALTANGLVQAEHLVDAAYVSAEHLVAARERHGIDPIEAARPGQSSQTKEQDAVVISALVVD